MSLELRAVWAGASWVVCAAASLGLVGRPAVLAMFAVAFMIAGD